MSYLYTAALLFVFSASAAQVRIGQVTGQVNLGVGICNKPETLFGTPVFYAADLAITLSNGWRIFGEGGQTAFRDADYPYQKLGFFFSTYSRYQHTYYGLRLGRNLLNANQTGQLFLSGGADYLAVLIPNLQPSSGLFAGQYHSAPYRNTYLNIPVQLDCSSVPFRSVPIRFSISGRWNVNSYHSFPAVSVGLDVPIYDRRMHPR